MQPRPFDEHEGSPSQPDAGVREVDLGYVDQDFVPTLELDLGELSLDRSVGPLERFGHLGEPRLVALLVQRQAPLDVWRRDDAPHAGSRHALDRVKHGGNVARTVVHPGHEVVVDIHARSRVREDHGPAPTSMILSSEAWGSSDSRAASHA